MVRRLREGNSERFERLGRSEILGGFGGRKFLDVR
jgi:hypothetical protein